jgi:hypothetical protein
MKRYLWNAYHGMLDIRAWDQNQPALPGSEWNIYPKAFPSHAHLKRFKDLHRGQHCFIIGDCPSLKHMDCSPLAEEITSGVNHFYQLFTERFCFEIAFEKTLAIYKEVLSCPRLS